MNLPLAAALVLTILCSIATSGHAISCYVCHSDANRANETEYHKNCSSGDLGGDINYNLAQRLVDCHEHTGSLYAQCSKKLHRKTGVTERACMLPVLPDDNRCDIKTFTRGYKENITYYGACVCSTDKCNSANGRYLASYALIVPILAVVGWAVVS